MAVGCRKFMPFCSDESLSLAHVDIAEDLVLHVIILGSGTAMVNLCAC